MIQRISLRRRIFSSSGWAFFTMFAWEGVETLLEYAIAYLISSAITMLLLKLLTTFLIVTATQTLLKPTQRFIMTFVRKLTYKKGDDKLEKIKQIWELFKSNKCSIAVVLCSALLGLSGANVINVDNLPVIPLGEGKVVEAVIQEEDVIATEIIYGKEAVYATETIYGEPIFATEVIWEKEPVYATETIYEQGKEPVYATNTVYSVEPVIADKLTFIANAVIYEDDGATIKYNVGDIVSNADVSNYTDKVDVFNAGDIIKEGVILFEKGDIIKEGTIKYNVGDIVEQGVKKFDIGDYMGNEILYEKGDVIVPAEILFNVGDVIVAKGTVLKEAETIPPTNLTPYIYYILLAIGTAVAGVFFELPKDYNARKELDTLKKQAKKEIAQEDNQVIIAQEQVKADEKAKLAEEEKAKLAEAKRLKLEKVKADIRAGNL